MAEYLALFMRAVPLSEQDDKRDCKHVPQQYGSHAGGKPGKIDIRFTLGNFKRMDFDVSTVLSLLSLVVAIATAVAAHHYFRRAQHQRDEDLIRSALVKFSQCRADAAVLKRERSKTGQPLAEYEHELFAQLELLSTVAERLEKKLIEILSSGKKITPDIRSATLSALAITEGLSTHVQMISAKFQNFNNNRFGKLVELQERLPKLESLLREHLRKS